MKVAISVPDPVFDAAEHMAKEKRVPRSLVFSEVLEEYVAKHNSSAVTAKRNAVYDGLGSQIDSFRRTRCARR